MPDSLLNSRFGAMYKSLKEAQSARGLADDSRVGFRAQATIDGKPLSNVMYVDHTRMRSRFSQPVVDAPGESGAARHHLRQFVETNYGQATADRVFRNLPSDRGNLQQPGVTLADLDHIHAELQKNHSFSAIHANLGGVDDDQHLRSRGALGSGSTPGKQLYVKKGTSWVWGKDYRKRSEYRRNAGQRVWRAIANEYGEQSADRVFRQVLGAPQDASHPHRVTITAGQVRQMKTLLDTGRETTRTGRFSTLFADVQPLRQNLPGSTRLHWSDQGRLQLPRGGTGLDSNTLRQQRAAVGPKLLQALNNEYGEPRSRAILERALPGRLQNGLTTVTLDDLDRIQQAIHQQTDAAIDDAADLEKLATRSDKPQQLLKKFDQVVAKNFPTLTSLDLKDFSPMDRDVAHLRAALALHAAGLVVSKGGPASCQAFAALTGADPGEMPDPQGNTDVLLKWMRDQLHRQFFKSGGDLGIDAGNSHQDKLQAGLVKQAMDPNKSPGEAIDLLHSALNARLTDNKGIRLRILSNNLTTGLIRQRHGAEISDGDQLNELHDQALVRADQRAKPDNRDEVIQQLKQQGKQGLGAFTPENTANRRDSVKQTDSDVSKRGLKRAQNQLKASDTLLETETIDKLQTDKAGNQPERPLLSEQALTHWIADRIAQHINQPRVLNDPTGFARSQVPQPQQPGGPLPPNDEKLIWTLALTDPARARELIEQTVFPAPYRNKNEEHAARLLVDKLYKGLMASALGVLSARGNWRNGNGNNISFNGREYRPVKQLGKGSFGEAYLYRSVDADENGNHSDVVVKQINSKYFDTHQNEVRAHLDLSHRLQQGGNGSDNVLGLSGVLFRQSTSHPEVGQFMTVSPVAAGGDMKELFARFDRAVQRGQISAHSAQLLKRRLIGQSISGMAYMQNQRQMVHKDLKPGNVLVSGDGNAKVADFGISTSGLKTQTWGGTSRYMAPEVAHNYAIRKQKWFKPAPKDMDAGLDVWSMGAMMRETLLGTDLLPGYKNHHYALNEQGGKQQGYIDQARAFSKKDSNRVYQTGQTEQRIDGRRQKQGMPFMPDSVDLDINKVRDINMLGEQEKLINAMMHPDPKQRPTMQAVAQHDYFSDPVLHEPLLKELTVALINRDYELASRLSGEVDKLSARGG